MTTATPLYDSLQRRSAPLQELVDLYSSGHVVLALVGRNVTLRYKRSVLGFLWTMAQPATLLLVVTLIFSRAFAPGATAYAVHVAPGLLLWYFFAQTTSAIAAEAGSKAELWRRAPIPRTAPAIATTLSGLINLVLATAALAAILPFAGAALGPALLTLPVTALLAGVFTAGVALLVGCAAMIFPDAADLYQVLLLPWMFITPVIYPRTILPVRVERLIVLNPMSAYVEAFRAPLTSGIAPAPAAFTAMGAIALATFIAGWIAFTRTTHAASLR